MIYLGGYSSGYTYKSSSLTPCFDSWAPELFHVFIVVHETVQHSGTHAQMTWNRVRIYMRWSPHRRRPYYTPCDLPSSPLLTWPKQSDFFFWSHLFPDPSQWIYGCLHGNCSVNSDRCCMLLDFSLTEKHTDLTESQAWGEIILINTVHDD